MRDSSLIQKYRLLDKECALFADKLRGDREFETDILIPDISYKASLEEELNSLQKKIATAEKPDPVFDLLQGHFMDFIGSQKKALQGMYERPSDSIYFFMYTFDYMAKSDSRPDKVRADIIIKRFLLADKIWEGIKTWLGDVSLAYLQELIDACNIYINTMLVETPKIPGYFPELNEDQHAELIEAVQRVSVKMAEWIKDVKKLMAGKGIVKSHTTSESDTVEFDEAYYRSLLSDRFGVELDELLSWYEAEIEKTRNEVFEVASKIKMSDPAPKTMAGVNDILLKYAGPCDSPEEMFRRANEYIKRTRAVCKEYVWLPDDESCVVEKVPEEYKDSYPWGGYGGGCPRRRPMRGMMFLNNYNYKAITDGWIKINTVHEAYPGHHVQFIRTALDPIPETVKMGAKEVPISEGTAHRSERAFEFIFGEDQFYPLFVAYRRHHTSVRIKADLMLRYFGRPIGDVVQLYVDELGFDRNTARGQVRAQESQQGYFTCYYYGMKKLCDWEKSYGYDKKKYTELLFSAGRISLGNFEKFLKLSESDKHSFLNDFSSLIQFK